MRRLVYSPKVNVWIKVVGGSIVDLSDYVVRGQVSRKINEVSTAQLEIRNPRKMWTQPDPKARAQIDPNLKWPFFHPMDPITIYLTRRPGFPVQVFTGWLDDVPYLELVPKTVTLKASCTLKKLMYAQWDPGLQYSLDFLSKQGWFFNQDGTIVSQAIAGQNTNITTQQGESAPPPGAPPNTPPGGMPVPKPTDDSDTSFKTLLYNSLQFIAGWNAADIYIDPLPPSLMDKATAIFNSIAKPQSQAYDELKQLLIRIIGPSGGGAGGGGFSGHIPHAAICGFSVEQTTNADVIAGVMESRGANRNMITAALMAAAQESSLKNINFGDRDSLGLFQMRPSQGWGSPAQVTDPVYATNKWFDVANGVAGHDTMDPGQLAQKVEVSAFPGAYAHWQPQIECLLNAATANPGGGPPPPAPPPGAPPGTPGPAGGGTPPAANTPTFPVVGGVVHQCPDSKCYCPRTNCPRGRPHCGSDIDAPPGTEVKAVGTGKITYNGVWGGAAEGEGPGANHVTVQQVGNAFIIYGHLDYTGPTVGTQVNQGDHMGTIDPGVGHLHFGVCSGQADAGCTGNGVASSGGGPGDGCQDPIAWLGNAQTGGGGAGGGGDPNSYTRAVAFASQLNLPGTENTAASGILQGEKALIMNQPLLQFIQDVCYGSLRSFMSMPDGKFYAFYPDYFGSFLKDDPKKPVTYWDIDDLEILDGSITLSDEPLATHVFVIGDLLFNSMSGQQNNQTAEYAATTGVVTITNALMGHFLNLSPSDINPNAAPPQPSTDKQQQQAQDPPLFDKNLALQFLDRYGARPMTLQQPQIRSSYLELIVAMRTFMLLWAKQFETDFKFTFMPELYPGGRVRFPSHGFQCFVQQVEHNFDYQSGFTTSATLTAPATIPNDPGKFDPLTVGMIKAAAEDQRSENPPTQADAQQLNTGPAPANPALGGGIGNIGDPPNPDDGSGGGSGP